MPEVHFITTVFMAGVIVFVQVVHYPLMSHVGDDAFPTYERLHTVRTGWVVVPPMLVELAGALWLAFLPPSPELARIAWLGLALLIAIWTSTFLLQAPAHTRLMRGFDGGVHNRLVRSNWLRTFAWIARVPIALLLVA